MDPDTIFLDIAREQRAIIKAANENLDKQNKALALAHTALLHAHEALDWYGALPFEPDGIKQPVSESIAMALNAIIGAKS